MPMGGIKIGYLPQEPELDPEKTVREEVESGLGEWLPHKNVGEVYAEYAILMRILTRWRKNKVAWSDYCGWFIYRRRCRA